MVSVPKTIIYEGTVMIKFINAQFAEYTMESET